MSKMNGIAKISPGTLFILSAMVCMMIFPAGPSIHALASDGPAMAGAPSQEPILLPAPDKTGGRPLMACLSDRRTGRGFDKTKPLEMQTLSNLLWAAAGVNRPETGLRTAPSAMNWQEIGIFVALEKGLFFYNQASHRLDPVKNEDLREFIGKQPFTSDAFAGLIYVARSDRMKGASEADKAFYSAADTGFISQNVYLFCASEGLATVVLGWVDKDELAKKMGLVEGDRIILTQPVGYPSK